MPFLLVLFAWMGFPSFSDTSAPPAPAAAIETATSSTPAAALPAWQLSPQAECEQRLRQRKLSLPGYCQDLPVRGEIPAGDEQLAALARQVMISVQLFFGDTRYGDSRSLAGQLPVIGFGFADALPVLADYSHLHGGHSQNGLRYLDSRHQQQWLARDLATCSYGGTVTGRVQDRGSIGQADAGDQWAVGEYSCLEPAFAPRPGPASFWLYDIGSRDNGRIVLKASGEMRRDLIGLHLHASAAASTLTLDPAQGRLLHTAAGMSYCASRQAGNGHDGSCQDLAVLLEDISLTRDTRTPGLNIREPARFTLALDRQPDGQHTDEIARYNIIIDSLEVPAATVLPRQGHVVIMGRHDDRLILNFTNDGRVQLQRLNALDGSEHGQTLPGRQLYDYAAWLGDMRPVAMAAASDASPPQ